MWKRIALDINRSYKLQLCQDQETHRRYCRIAETGDRAIYEACVVFETGAVPNELLAGYQWETIQKNFHTTSGQRFEFGSHGEWFSERESAEMLEYDLGKLSEVKWETNFPPRFPIA